MDRRRSALERRRHHIALADAGQPNAGRFPFHPISAALDIGVVGFDDLHRDVVEDALVQRFGQIGVERIRLFRLRRQ